MKRMIPLLLAALVTLPLSALAAEDSPKPLTDAQRAKLEKQLSEARTALNEKAREIARLSMQLNEMPDHPMRLRMLRENHGRLGLMVFGTSDTGSVDGVKVVGVTPGGPGATAGLKSGDVIVSVNGSKLAAENSGEALDRFMRQLHDVKPGDTVKLEYQRDGKTASASLKATAGPTRRDIERHVIKLRGMEGGRHPFGPLPPMAGMLGPWHGIQMVDLSPELGGYFKTDKGVLVVRAPKSDSLPLKDGDVIVKIGTRTPQDPAQAMRILMSYNSGDSVKLEITRHGDSQTLDVKVPEAPAMPNWHPAPAPPAPKPPQKR